MVDTKSDEDPTCKTTQDRARFFGVGSWASFFWEVREIWESTVGTVNRVSNIMKRGSLLLVPERKGCMEISYN